MHLSKKHATQLFHRPLNRHSVGRACPRRAGIVKGDPICISRGREKSCMPSGGKTRTYSVNRGQRRRPPVSDSLQSPFRDYSRRKGGRQVNHPAPIGVGIGQWLLSETLVRLQQRIGTHSPARTVAKQSRTEGSLCSVRAAVEH